MNISRVAINIIRWLFNATHVVAVADDDVVVGGGNVSPYASVVVQAGNR